MEDQTAYQVKQVVTDDAQPEVVLSPALGFRGEDVQWYEPIVVLAPWKVQIGDHSRIDSFVKIEGGVGVVIGQYVHVSSFSHLNVGGGQLVIGDYVAIASGARILGGSNRPEGLAMSAAAPASMQLVQRTLTVIDRYAFVATGAIVLPGVHLGEGAVVAAGAVATQDVPPWEIWGGNPARFLKHREVAPEYGRPS